MRQLQAPCSCGRPRRHPAARSLARHSGESHDRAQGGTSSHRRRRSAPPPHAHAVADRPPAHALRSGGAGQPRTLAAAPLSDASSNDRRSWPAREQALTRRRAHEQPDASAMSCAHAGESCRRTTTRVTQPVPRRTQASSQPSAARRRSEQGSGERSHVESPRETDACAKSRPALHLPRSREPLLGPSPRIRLIVCSTRGTERSTQTMPFAVLPLLPEC